MGDAFNQRFDAELTCGSHTQPLYVGGKHHCLIGIKVHLVAGARTLASRLAMSPGSNLEDIGAQESVGAPYAARLMRLNYLAPDIVTAIFNGRQPACLTASKLIVDTRLPLAWEDQRKALGFA